MTPINNLILVYHANSDALSLIVDGTRKLLSLKGCTLCQITHGYFTEKSEWKRCRESFGVPVTALHLDELDPSLEKFVAGRTPCIVAETPDGYEFLLEPDVIERCAGSPNALRGKLLYHAALKNLALGSQENEFAGAPPLSAAAGR